MPRNDGHDHFPYRESCAGDRLRGLPSDFPNFALQFARIRIAFDVRLRCRRSLIGTMLHYWGFEYTRAMCVPNEATTSTDLTSHVVRSEPRGHNEPNVRSRGYG